MPQSKIRVGIAGAAGYTGGELIRLLVNHPSVELSFAHSMSQSGKPVSSIHTDLIGETELCFTNTISQNIDVLFLCVGHGDGKRFTENNHISESIKIIDLSQDFRLKRKGNNYVYGLPELNSEKISEAHKLANPGCFATCIQLALLPLAAKKLLKSDIHITATTGSTGAGQSPNATSHFSWRSGNHSVYKAFEHQHLGEIGQSITQLHENFSDEIHFIPYRGSFARGILASLYLDCELNEKEVKTLFREYYKSAPFVHLSEMNIDLKQVVNTNKCLLYIQKHGNKLLIVSAIDNLLKGASGQALQNMNIMFGLPQNEGLKLKATAF